jgi:phthiocerol/phenolphthiocerol synthesis type-I polyketide synthase E
VVDADALAVVGMALRAPLARSLAEFWDNVCAGRECLTTLPEAGSNDRVPVKGVLDGAEEFDAEFFGFSPREAEITDPQQRTFLQLVWHALEDAGHTPASCGRVGVFASATQSRYADLLERSDPTVRESVGDLQLRIATESDFLATRVAYRLNLRGPALTVQTACSSSLVAVHLACNALLSGDCDTAVAGGVTITLPLRSGYRYQTGSILSPDGHCRAFDARAKGTVPGNGGGAVVLRRLEDALADGDDVYAVVLGSAVNNDGSDKIGFTAPSSAGQEAVIRTALRVAGVDPDDVGLVEAHGTGTPLGDPVELAGLRAVFGSGRPGDAWCGLGSVKSNVGHLDAAAGIAGFVKAVCAVEAGVVPPTVGFEEPNADLELARSPFRVVPEFAPWPVTGRRIAGVSAFGVGGTNAHVVLAEAPPRPAPVATRRRVVVPLSARSPAAVERLAAQLAGELEARAELDLDALEHTLLRGRVALPYRLAVVGSDRDELVHALRAAGTSRAAGDGGPALLFPGQGSHWRRMGRSLLAVPEYRRVGERAREILAEPLWLDVAPDDLATRTDVVQVALFVHQTAMVELLARHGVRPAALLGHSVGEFSAACRAGVLSFEDALRAVVVRGTAMQRLCPPGAMLAVKLDEGEAAARLADDVELAAINGPARCVLSGPVESVERLERDLRAEGVACRRLDVDRAFHSASVAPAADALREHLRGVELHVPKTPLVSAATGRWLTPAQATDPDFWARQILDPVRFADGVETLRRLDVTPLDVGPGTTLAQLAGGLALWDPRAGDDEEQALWQALAGLWQSGVDVDWDGGERREGRRRLHLPGYPFERARHWPEGDAPEPASEPETPRAPARLDGERAWIAELFGEVLGVAPGSETDGFFELGGDSLMAVQLLSRISDVSGVEPDLERFFDEPTVAGIAAQLEHER